MENTVEKKPALLEDVELIFRNFSGEPGKYNRQGSRHFSIKLDDSVANEMLEDGWNVRYLKPRDEEDSPQAILEVAVNFDGRFPPQIYIITSRGKTRLDEDSVSMLDWAEIRYVDLSINPYHWEIKGESGVKAYLRSLYVTIEEDDLEKKYFDVPDSARSAMVGREDEEAPWGEE